MRHPIIEEDLCRIAAFALPWEEFAEKTVIVSGASGLLSAYMVETLLYLNERRSKHATRVVGLVRSLERANSRFAAYQGRDDLQLIAHDVTEPLPALPRADYVVHAASQASPKYYTTDPVGTLSANVLGTHHLLTLAKESRSRGFLFFSSGDVYGRAEPSYACLRECDYGVLDPLDIRSCYGESKRMGETMCACWFRQYQVPTKIVRIGHTYGPGMRLDDGRVHADFVADVVQRRPIVVKSDGSARRPFCYLADATTAFFTVLLEGESGQAYNVANVQCECSVLELAELLAGLFPERKLQVVCRERNAGDSRLVPKARTVPLDVTRLRALGWKPTTGLAEGFSRTIRSYE